MRKTIAAVLLIAALVAVAVMAGRVAVGSAEGQGRQLVGGFCTNPNALPKPGACMALSVGETTAQGYTASPDRVLTLRPGTYWLTVNDTSAVHNFSLEDPNGVDDDLTGIRDAPGEVTVKVNLTHGTYTLFCDPHRMMGMYVVIEVGGVGQVG
jgi:plastocyanin